MSFQWFKRYLPRGIYGRAALILLLPVVVVQIVVSVLIAERHFSGVTQQMTRTMIREITLMLDTVDTTANPDTVAEAVQTRLGVLDIQLDLVSDSALPAADTRLWYDFTGTVFTPMLRQALPGLQRVLLAKDNFVVLYTQTRHGLARLEMPRNRFSPSKSHQLFVYLLFFGALMSVISYIYLRNQLRPITRLATASEAFGRGRHVPYSPAGATEVRAAGMAFVDMRNRIERHIEQRTLMLSGVSHDLRTPLTRMRLELSMLEDDDARATLEHDVDEMQRLVDEFLNFAQGASEGTPQDMDPVRMVQDVVQDSRRAGRNVTLFQAEGAGRMELRETAMRRALDNLVSNAVRYGTRAEVSVLLTDRTLRIRVEDDGPGIPQHQREEAQKPFVRLDKARNQDLGAGVGLGLAIAADITHSHGGSLRLDDSARMGGLCAEIIIAR